CPMAREVVQNVNRLASVVRAVGGGVFWIKNAFDERASYEWSNAHVMLTAESQGVAAMSEGTKGQELWPELDVRPEGEIANTGSVRLCRGPAVSPIGCGHVGLRRC